MSDFLTGIEVMHALSRIESGVNDLSSRLEQFLQAKAVRDYYTVEQVAEMLDRKKETVREWCRNGRIGAKKLEGGRGNEGEWRIPHSELIRYQSDGLLPPTSSSAMRY